MVAALFWGGVLAPVRTAKAEFLPGYLYVSDPRVETCGNPNSPRDQIWEVNSQTGESRVFATLPDEFCGGLFGLAFTPDGQFLRASAFLASTILEIDGDGGVRVALGPSDGIGGPQGSNNIAYDALGNFYVGNLSPRRLLRFSAAGGPPEVVLNASNGLTGSLSLAPGPDGSLWAAELATLDDQLWRIRPDGTIDTFALGNAGGISIAIDLANNVYLHSGLLGIYKIPNGDYESMFLLTDRPFGQGTILVSPLDGALFVVAGSTLNRVDPITGDVTTVGQIPSDDAGFGAAFYIPEPSTMLALAAGACWLLGRARASHCGRWSHD